MDRVTIFVQVPDEKIKEMGNLLGKIPQSEYLFVILPLEAKLLTKAQLVEIIGRALKGMEV